MKILLSTKKATAKTVATDNIIPYLICRFHEEVSICRFHELRHTYTTNLLSNGAQPKDVQELLGHSDVSTTINVYAHATREAKRESAKLLDKVVGMN